MDTNLELPFQLKLRWIYVIGFCLILLMPLNIIPFWSFPIGWGKAIFFRIIFSVLAYLFCLQVLFKKINLSYLGEKIKAAGTPFWLLIALLIINLLATIFSVDPSFSLWGTPARSGGFMNYAFFIAFAIFSFLMIEKRDWRKILDFSIIVGVVVAGIAVIQQFDLYAKIFLPFTDRPASTIGNSILLSTYLLLLSFFPISFGLKEKKLYKKIFYFASFLLFITVSIFLSQTRGAIVGLVIGFFWFFFNYPAFRSFKKAKIYVVAISIALIVLVLGTKSYLDHHLDAYKQLPPVVASALDRTLNITEGVNIIPSRISAWTVALKGVEDKPILGYGPENFQIAFDKFYDPTLPVIGPDELKRPMVEWWDRAHNILLDTAVSTGIPSLVIYLALFGSLIWNLQRLKNKDPENAEISHAIQTTFIGYLIALLFSFDCFDTYLISFLLIGYSLYLISDYSAKAKPFKDSYKYDKLLDRINIPLAIILGIGFIWFIWVYNWIPLKQNRDLSQAYYYPENGQCSKAFSLGSEFYNSKTTIAGYLKQNYAIQVLHDCRAIGESKYPDQLAQYGVNLLKMNAEAHPERVQNWAMLAEYSNILMEEKNKLTGNVYSPTPEMEQIKSDTISYFAKANALSPKRQVILKEWAKTGLITGDLNLAREKAKECIDLNPNYSSCEWELALAEGYAGNTAGFDQYVKMAKEKGFNIDAPDALQQLINMNIQTKNYKGLTENYLKLIATISEKTAEGKNKKAQLYAALAVVYRDLGDMKKARESANKAMDLQPSAKADVEEFLKTLK